MSQCKGTQLLEALWFLDEGTYNPAWHLPHISRDGKKHGCPSWFRPVKQRNGKHPKSMFFRKNFFIVATKMKTHHLYGKLENCTVWQFCEVTEDPEMRPPPHPVMHPCIHTPEKVLYQNTSLFLFVFIFVKTVYSMAIVKNNDLLSKYWLKAYSRAARYFSNIRVTRWRAICFPRIGG